MSSVRCLLPVTEVAFLCVETGRSSFFELLRPFHIAPRRNSQFGGNSQRENAPAQKSKKKEKELFA